MPLFSLRFQPATSIVNLVDLEDNIGHQALNHL